MIFERGELLLVPFPFTDLSGTKRRPVLALTSPDGYADFVAMPVTSRPQHAHALPISADELVSGSLPVASWIRTDRIVTLNAGLVAKSIARVSSAALHRAVREFCDRLGRS